MAKRVNLTEASPIEDLQGIGRARSRSLAEIRIYSVGDYLASTRTEEGSIRVAAHLGITDSQIRAIRDEAIASLAGSVTPAPFGKRFRPRILILISIVMANAILLGGGTLIGATTFSTVTILDVPLSIFENDVQSPSAFGYRVKIQSSAYAPRKALTTIALENDFDPGFTEEFPGSVPEGIFFACMPSEVELTEITARVGVIETYQERLEGPWTKNLERESWSVELPTKVEETELDNYCGRNLIVWIDASDFENEWERQSSQWLHFKVEVELTYNGQSSQILGVLDQIRSGTMSVHSKIWLSEVRYLGIGKPKWGELEMPEVELQTEEGKLERRFDLEYMWVPEMEGDFLSPDEMIGGRLFYEAAGGIDSVAISADFVYQTAGAQWWPFIAGLIGVEILVGVFQYFYRR